MTMKQYLMAVIGGVCLIALAALLGSGVLEAAAQGGLLTPAYWRTDGPPRQVSDAATAEFSSSAAYNPAANQFLAVWESKDALRSRASVYGRLVGPDGQPAADAFVIADAVRNGEQNKGPEVVYNSVLNEY